MESTGEPGKNLLDIPNEMIQRIATFLPDHAVAALCLTSKKALKILGKYQLTKISCPVPAFGFQDDFIPRQRQGPEDERWKLLRLLDDNLKEYILCQYCQKLHKPVFMMPKPRPDCYYFLWRRFNPNFPDYTLIQFAMKQHRLKLSTQIALRKLDEKFSRLRISARTYDPVPSIEGRIVSVLEQGRTADKLYVEYKVERLLPIRISSGLLEGCDRYIKVCVHMQRQVRVMFECQAIHYYKRENPCSKCAVMKHCDICRTEMLVEIEWHADPYSLIVVRVWQDLGEGYSLYDPVWWSHSEEIIRDTEVQQKLKFKPGSIRRVFEAAGAVEEGWNMHSGTW